MVKLELSVSFDEKLIASSDLAQCVLRSRQLSVEVSENALDLFLGSVWRSGSIISERQMFQK